MRSKEIEKELLNEITKTLTLLPDVNFARFFNFV